MLAALALPAAAQVDVHLFWREGCPHCEREIAFLERLSAANPDIRIHKYEVSRNRANAELMIEAAGRLGVEAGSVPLTVILLGLLAGMKDRRRMWLLGGAFVAASAAGGYYVKEFVTNADMKCEVTAPERRRRVLERLKRIAQQPRFIAALGGIVLLAFAVNVVEFLCSAGIPAVFAQVLALSALAPWEYFAYLVLYVGVFMVDDLVVLVAALKTLEVTGLTTRYARWSNAVGGAALLAIGVALVFRPEWLAFG